MKRIFFALAAALSLLVSCGKEKPEEDYGLFREPLLIWGASQDEVISKVGQPTEKIGNLLKYDSDESRYEYYFWDNKLIESSVYLPLSVSFEDLVAFLKEKYVILEEFGHESLLYFNTKDGETIIEVNENIHDTRGIAYSKIDGFPL
ncbi:MAG: hypothetical protein KIG38_06660 [Bacteroidales bacterium]|nr:hypothetical protein [Bacteroidales bacterium]